MLPLWVGIVLALGLAGSLVWVLRLRARERRLIGRLQSRERGGHFLSESPDLRQILRHAYTAIREILPVSRFVLFLIGEEGRVEEAWTAGPGPDGTPSDPSPDPANPHLGEWIDPSRLLQLTATETDRSFAPRDLLAGRPSTKRLRLPLYSGDRLIAHLVLESPEVIDDARKSEIRALLGPLTSSLHALRNWTIAVTDELSGLASRRYFETRLSEEWARNDRYGSSLAIACFDLDHFKAVNDTYGHAGGDRVIRRFGAIVRNAIRVSDVACRHGGEEFAILFPEAEASAALAVAERIRLTLAKETFEFEGRMFSVTVSAGIAEAASVPTRDQLMYRADKALYAAKEAGRNKAVVWSPPPGSPPRAKRPSAEDRRSAPGSGQSAARSRSARPAEH
ncbi:MAG TPA: sensor domain-containing diguanylate cyclase [Thermoanaerobaculia bacterium]